MDKFKVGDRVEATQKTGNIRIGKEGVIKNIRTSHEYTVEMDEAFAGGHDGDNDCRDGHGRFVLGEYFKLVKKGDNKVKTVKRIGTTIKVGMKVIDRNCSNKGVVVTIYPEQEQVVYKDLDSNKMHLVGISDLYIPLLLPEVKVKKKAKKKK